MYYDSDFLESELETIFWSVLNFSKAYIDAGGDDPDTIYPDMDLYAPAFTFRSMAEQYEYRSIVRKWDARFRSEIDEYRRARNKKNAMAEARRRAEREEEAKRQRLKREREEEEEEEERRRERKRKEEEKRRKEEEERRRKEEEEQKAEAKRKEQDKKNREELNRIQEEWNTRNSPSQSPQPQQSTDSIFCTACGSTNAKTARFCTKCGTQLQMKCPSCGGFIRVGSKFCSWCGSPISQSK